MNMNGLDSFHESNPLYFDHMRRCTYFHSNVSQKRRNASAKMSTRREKIIELDHMMLRSNYDWDGSYHSSEDKFKEKHLIGHLPPWTTRRERIMASQPTDAMQWSSQNCHISFKWKTLEWKTVKWVKTSAFADDAALMQENNEIHGHHALGSGRGIAWDITWEKCAL